MNAANVNGTWYILTLVHFSKQAYDMRPCQPVPSARRASCGCCSTTSDPAVCTGADGRWPQRQMETGRRHPVHLGRRPGSCCSSSATATADHRDSISSIEPLPRDTERRCVWHRPKRHHAHHARRGAMRGFEP